MAVGEYIGNGNPDGTSIGYSASEKVSLYGVTPVTQAAVVSFTTTAAVSCTSSASVFGYDSTTANAIVTTLKAHNTALTNLGILAAS